MTRIAFFCTSIALIGCGSQDLGRPSTDWISLKEQWAVASREERRGMVAVPDVVEEFRSATKARIREFFGEPDKKGIDSFGVDVMRYEFGELPGANGEFHYHLTFVFKNGRLVDVLGVQ